MKRIFLLTAMASMQLTAAQYNTAYPESNFPNANRPYQYQGDSRTPSTTNTPTYQYQSQPQTQTSYPNQYNTSPNQYNTSPNQYNTNPNPYNTSPSSSSFNTYNQSSDTYDTRRNTDSNKQPETSNQDFASGDDDQQINRKIREKLTRSFSPRYVDTLFLETANGTVTIKGTVKEASDIDEIVESVRKVKGVKGVNIRLDIRPQHDDDSDERYSGSNSNNKNNVADLTQDRIQKAKYQPGAYNQDYAASEKDRQLNLRIREKLSTWFTSGYNDTIILKTSNGDVTLEGRVDNPEDIQRIVDSLRRIEGVNNITNRLKANRGSVPV